jgi:RNA-splicing ligase RtcB
MIVIKGAYNSATVYADWVESAAEGQIRTLCNQPFVEGLRIRIMPDVHFSAGCTVGTTMTLKDRIIPGLVGVDIGCGMEVARLDAAEIDPARLDEIVHDQIPSGFEVREKIHPFAKDARLGNLRCSKYVKLNVDRAYRSIGTLGGGNHFIEADRDDDGRLYIVVHTGSRHLGVEVAEYYQNEGYRRLIRRSGKKQKDKQGKKNARWKEGTLSKEERHYVPRPQAYVADDLFDDYLHDMKLTQIFAELNRKTIMRTLLDGLGVKAAEHFTTIHNYIDVREMILRKGAVSAKAGERLIIPMNMRDGSLICIGKGNAEWNFSAPHGAGRLMSRSEAREGIDLSDYRRSMEGIYSTSVTSGTLDEAPMAYKAMEDIIGRIADTVDIVSRIKPIYNFKASNGKSQGILPGKENV